MKITLQRALDPDRKIQAIKSLRDATRPEPGAAGTTMGLREAKDIVDVLIPVTRGTLPRHVAGVEVEDTGPLVGIFEFTVERDPSTDIPRDAVLDLLLAAVGFMTPNQAHDFMDCRAYGAIRELL
jgi:hypothetical protein